MSFWSVLLLLVAGTAAGLSGSIAGLASLFSYPALLAVGLAPVTANVTNTVALVFNSVGSVSGSRPELASQWGRVRRLAPAGVAGGIVGGALLLVGPAGAFERIVPWLIAVGSLTILINPRPPVDPDAPPRRESRAVIAGTFVIGIYGGYFGAAAGVLLLALLLVATSESLAHSNAVKNVVLGGANAVAAAIFAVYGSVDWLAAIPLAVGLFIGGHTGPIVVRRTPARLLRRVIAVAGLGLAGYLGFTAYT
ncbi:sulfite exporter TauE/SafE family protein [uncultured Jatrophihabitans sp.]|uniref:sulfite exporter TauE/SafE family protein n=1 Tax=uncultured Jatrophihabitans sp. TaxID=1610747 RepID=UPI0035C993DD